MRKKLLAALAGSALGFAPAAADACTPRPETAESVAKVLAGSDHSFRGTVAEIAPHPAEPATGRVRFSVERVYKGAPAAGDWYRYLKFDLSHCQGWTPQIGQRAIFFVYRHADVVWVALLWGLYDDEKMMEDAARMTDEKQ
jgi:hypothetical protein